MPFATLCSNTPEIFPTGAFMLTLQSKPAPIAFKPWGHGCPLVCSQCPPERVDLSSSIKRRTMPRFTRIGLSFGFQSVPPVPFGMRYSTVFPSGNAVPEPALNVEAGGCAGALPAVLGVFAGDVIGAMGALGAAAAGGGTAAAGGGTAATTVGPG